MKQFLCVVLLALVCVNSMKLMDKYPINFTQKRSIMTLLTQVEAKLKAGGPLDSITKMLNEFVSAVNQEQANHDNLWAEQQAECDDEISFREQEIKNASAAYDEAQETLTGCQSQKVRASSDLAITKKQLVETRNFLASVEDTRRREAYSFETASTTYQLATRAVEEALDILEEIWSGESSFVQLSKHINGLLKHSIKLKKAHLMNGALSAMVQLANKDIQADDELLNRVKTLLTNFKSKLEQEYQAAVAEEEAAIEAYTHEKASLEENIQSLTAQQDGLKAEVQELNKCIVTQSDIVSSAGMKRDRNQRLLDDAQNLCKSVEEEYKTASEARKEELELIAAIQERVELRFSELSEGVTARGKQDNFEYEANYDYEQQQFKPSNAQ